MADLGVHTADLAVHAPDLAVHARPIWLFTLGRSGCSRSADLAVHDRPESASLDAACAKPRTSLFPRSQRRAPLSAFVDAFSLHAATRVMASDRRTYP
jgi:hypothetical protein